MHRILRAVLALAVLLVPLSAVADSWEWVGNIDGVKTWKKEIAGQDTLAFKGELFANVDIGKVLEVFTDGKHRRHWVDRYDAHKTYQKQPLIEEYWIEFDLPWPVSNRDYVLRSDGIAKKDESIFVCNIKSIVRKDAPEDDCCVRAQAFQTYYKFEAFKGKTRTKLTVEVHTDPKGMLPTWLVNMLQKKWPSKTLSGLVAHAKKVNKIKDGYDGWHLEPPPPPPPPAVETPPAGEAPPAGETAPAAPAAPAVEATPAP